MAYTLPNITDLDNYLLSRRYAEDSPTRRGANVQKQQDVIKALPALGLDGLPLQKEGMDGLGLTQEELISASPYTNINQFETPVLETPVATAGSFASPASPYMNVDLSNMGLTNPVYTPPPPINPFTPPPVPTSQYPRTANGYRNIGAVSSKVSAAPGSFLSKMFHVESKNGTLKDKPGNSHTGIGQMGTKEITSALKGTKYSHKDYANNVDVQKFAAKRWSNSLKTELVNRKIEPTDFNMWLGWNLGGNAAKEILSGKVSAKTLANIRNQAGMNKKSTVEDYVDYYRKLF